MGTYILDPRYIPGGWRPFPDKRSEGSFTPTPCSLHYKCGTQSLPLRSPPLVGKFCVRKERVWFEVKVLSVEYTPSSGSGREGGLRAWGHWQRCTWGPGDSVLLSAWGRGLRPIARLGSRSHRKSPKESCVGVCSRVVISEISKKFYPDDCYALKQCFLCPLPSLLS